MATVPVGAATVGGEMGLFKKHQLTGGTTTPPAEARYSWRQAIADTKLFWPVSDAVRGGVLKAVGAVAVGVVAWLLPGVPVGYRLPLGVAFAGAGG